MKRTTHNTSKLAVVFLHGMFGTPENWRASMEALSLGSGARLSSARRTSQGSFATAVPSYAGRAEDSDALPECDCEVHAPLLPVFHTPERRDPVEFLAQLVRDYLRAHRIERAVLVGNSLGGHVAVRVALLETERVVGLVLSGSSGLFERGLERNVPRRPTREWLRLKTAQVFFDARHVTEAMLDEVSAVVLNRRSALQLIRVAQSAKRDHLAPLLPRVEIPTLLVWGEEDQITPLSTAWQFYELLPNSVLETIPHCGHAPMMEQPKRFNELLARFVSPLACSGEVLAIAHRAEQEEAGTHARQNREVPAEVREAAAA